MKSYLNYEDRRSISEHFGCKQIKRNRKEEEEGRETINILGVVLGKRKSDLKGKRKFSFQVC